MDIQAFIAQTDGVDSTRRVYRFVLEKAERTIGRPLSKASRHDVEALATEYRKMRGGPQYAKVVRLFYKASGKDDLAVLLKLKQRLRRLRPDDILTRAEVQRMIEACGSARDRALVACLWETGVRIHELLAVDLGDVRMQESPENGGRKMYVVWFKKTKIAGEEHEGYVLEAAPVLSAWITAHPDPRREAPLFPSWSGSRLTPEGALGLIHRVARKAKIGKRVYPHLFRHSRATDLLRLGVPETQIKQLLGWSPASPMLTRYAHLANRDAKAAYMKAYGLEPPAKMDVERLRFEDETLKPILPMVAAPGKPVRFPKDEMEKLLGDPNVLRFLELARTAAGKS